MFSKKLQRFCFIHFMHSTQNSSAFDEYVNECKHVLSTSLFQSC